MKEYFGSLKDVDFCLCLDRTQIIVTELATPGMKIVFGFSLLQPFNMFLCLPLNS